jgi:NADH dehydrogenase
MDRPHRVVIVGGGFGGLNAARNLRGIPVQVTLLDRRNFHLFQPLLYQVATGGLSPANIAAPLRALFRRQRNVDVLLAEVTDIDARGRRVILRDGTLAYDTLVLATGARHHYFGKDAAWEPLAPGLKTIEDATEIRRRILVAFEKAEVETDPARQQALLTFVVVGGGPTGVELAGTLGELAHFTLRREFHKIDPTKARILLLEGTERVLPPYKPDLSAKAARALERLGVTVQTNTTVTDIQPDFVTVRRGELVERIPAHTVLWAAGVLASPLGRALERATGVKLDRAGRVFVEPNLTVPGYPDIYVIGDLASLADTKTGKPLPGVAPVAIQQGQYVARLIAARLRGQTLPPFAYRDRGSMATIGRSAAVADLGWIRFSGFFAWLAWLFVHLLYLVEFQNRLLVMVQWAWNYFTRNRAARLITGDDTARIAEGQQTALPVFHGR